MARDRDRSGEGERTEPGQEPRQERARALRGGSGAPQQAQAGRVRTDVLLLSAVGLLVVLVSLPRLSVFAMQENETDALVLVRTLAELPLRGDAQAPLVVGDLDLDQGQRWMRDLEIVDGGARLARYGYLFDLVEEGEHRVVRAWPARFGHTGRRAFVHTIETQLDQPGTLNEHANPKCNAMNVNLQAGGLVVVDVVE